MFPPTLPPFATQRCWPRLSSAYLATLLATFLLTRVIISATLAKTWDGGKIFPPPGLFCLTSVCCSVPPGVCLLTKFTKWRHIPRDETDGSAVQQSLTLVKISCQHSQVDTTSITTLSHTSTLSRGRCMIQLFLVANNKEDGGGWYCGFHHHHTASAQKAKEDVWAWLILWYRFLHIVCLTKWPRARARLRLVIKIGNKLFYQNTKRITDYKLLYQTLPNGHHHHNRKI